MCVTLSVLLYAISANCIYNYTCLMLVSEHILINTNLIIKIDMSAFNPLASILSNNRLDGTNYVSWKRNLNIVLTCEGII